MKVKLPGPPPTAPPSLAGATMDIRSSSNDLAVTPLSSSRGLDSDEEVIAWAKRRGYVSFLFFFVVAVAVAATWTFAR